MRCPGGLEKWPLLKLFALMLGRHPAGQMNYALAALGVVSLVISVYALVDARLGMLRNYKPEHSATVPAPADPAPETVFAEPAPLPAPDIRFLDGTNG